MLQIEVITLFPEIVRTVAEYGIVGRAVQRGLLRVNTHDPRDHASRQDGRVDDRPYGGGPGMVMMVEPLCAAITEARNAFDTGDNICVIYLSPQGQKLDHDHVTDLAKRRQLILIAGRYEGIDERVIDKEVDEEWSIGDYVLSGGELPAMVMIDVLTRMLPGALGHKDSVKKDSFFNGLLNYPQYTRPHEVNLGEHDDRRVPGVLLSGDHEEIAGWRLKQALGRTWLKRPDLLEELQVDGEQQYLLEMFKKEYLKSNVLSGVSKK